MVRSRFDQELESLNQKLIKMGSLIEKAIEDACKALINQDTSLAKQVIKADTKINEIEKSIEIKCLKLLLQQQPVASDLRLISAVLKIITDMERIGDQAQDISEITLNLTNQDYIKELTHISAMSKATIEMVRDSINAFINQDIKLARKVILCDELVDELFDIIKVELISLIRDDIQNSQQAIDFLMIAKYLERIGDHAENISEWVIFSITGEHIDEI